MPPFSVPFWDRFCSFFRTHNLSVFYFLAKSDSWNFLWEFLGASWTTKRPRCSQDGPKSPHKAPKGSPRASKRPPEGLQDAFSRLQMASKNVSKGPSNKEKTICTIYNRCDLTLLSINVFYYLRIICVNMDYKLQNT